MKLSLSGGDNMIKSLIVTIDDINQDDKLSIQGTLSPKEFNKAVVLSIGQTKIAVDSQVLAEALAAVVSFQTPTPPPLTNTYEFRGIQTEQFIGGGAQSIQVPSGATNGTIPINNINHPPNGTIVNVIRS